MSQYFGIDWVAMVMTFTAIYLLGGKRRTGFLLMICGNILWMVIGLWAHSYAMLIANAGFVTMNVRGYWKWREARSD